MRESGDDQLRALAQEEEAGAILVEVLIGFDIVEGLHGQAEVDVGRSAVRSRRDGLEDLLHATMEEDVVPR